MDINISKWDLIETSTCRRQREGEKESYFKPATPCLKYNKPFTEKQSREKKKKSMEISVETTDVLNTSEGANTWSISNECIQMKVMYSKQIQSFSQFLYTKQSNGNEACTLLYLSPSPSNLKLESRLKHKWSESAQGNDRWKRSEAKKS